jgi:hypothetical protein
MRTLMSTAEVTRVLNLTPASVRFLARRARLRVALSATESPRCPNASKRHDSGHSTR